jgi:hypothetical protein
MTNKFALLKLFPAGNFQSGNLVLSEIRFDCPNARKEAIAEFQRSFPLLKLNDDGYAKDGEITYCVAECI